MGVGCGARAALLGCFSRSAWRIVCGHIWLLLQFVMERYCSQFAVRSRFLTREAYILLVWSVLV